MSRVAFLGTGTMGLPMARNLLAAGHDVRVWNRSPERAEPLREAGAEVLAGPGEAAEGCATVITMLSDAEAVLAVAEPALAAGPASWIQMSTIGLDGTERCAELAARHDVRFVDAPVLGTKAPAEQGKLIVLASGPQDALRDAAPLFEAVAARTLELGEAGASSRLKVVINGWIVGVVGVLAETIALARALELEPQRFFDAIDGGPLDLPYARLKGAAMIDEAFDDVSFRLALARKDGDLLLAAAADHGLELPVMAAVVERFRAAEAAGHADKDMAAVFLAGRD